MYGQDEYIGLDQDECLLGILCVTLKIHYGKREILAGSFVYYFAWYE